eukprot:4377248-Prymnesium_polylepis.1
MRSETAAPPDLHLSDVHLRAEEGSDGAAVTIFSYGLGGAAEDAEDAVGVDADGDVCVRRKRRRQTGAAGW